MTNSLLLLFSLALSAAAAPDAPSIDTLMDNGHWKRARAAVEASYKANPNDAHVNYLMARLRQRYGNLDDAAKYAEAAVKLDPKVSAHHRILGEIYGDQAEKVSVFKQISLGNKIKSEFETALQLDPNHWENISNKVSFYMEAPGILGGDKKKAREIANDLVKRDPVHGYQVLAYIASKENNKDEVARMRVAAANADPKNYEANLELAGMYLNSGRDFDKAEQHARACMESQPDRVGGYRLLAYALAAQKRPDEVAKLVVRAAAAIPDDISPYVLAARGFLLNGVELDKAEAYLKKYLAETTEPEPSAPLIAGTHWSLALVYEKQGHKPEAIAELQAALRLKPDFKPAQNDLKRITGA